MSLRENISNWFVDQLKNQRDFRIGTVTRDPKVDISNLAATAFPAVIIQSTNETRADYTQGGPAILRHSMMDVVLDCWFKEKPTDSVRNELIEKLEHLYDADRTADGNAMDIQLTRVEVTDHSEKAPYVKMTVVWQVQYMYQRGNA